MNHFELTTVVAVAEEDEEEDEDDDKCERFLSAEMDRFNAEMSSTMPDAALAICSIASIFSILELYLLLNISM